MRVAVLGAGRMGRLHLRIVRSLGWDLVGVLDEKQDMLAEAGRELGIAEAMQYKDAARLMEEGKPECVIVATTAPGHGPLTCLAAEAGARYILCEKPMATSLAECDRMIAACRRQGTRLAINHQMRFMEQYLVAKRIIESDEFGPWASLTVVAGNFGMAMNGTHYFELLRWLSGEAPAEITAWFSTGNVPNPRGRQFQDSAGSIRVTTPGGKRLYMEIGDDQGHGIRTVYAGRAGILVADDLSGCMQLAVRHAESRALPTSRYALPSRNSTPCVAPTDGLAASRAVLEALVAGHDYPSGEDGRTAVATLVAAHVSHENGHRPVGLESLPREREFAYP